MYRPRVVPSANEHLSDGDPPPLRRELHTHAGAARIPPSLAAEDPTRAQVPAVRDDVCVLVLADIAPRWRAWGWSRIAEGGWPLRRVPGLVFAKALGSGHEGGFGLRPSASHQGLFATFANEEAAAAFADRSALVARYRERSDEFALLTLRATSSRGAWGGHTILATRPPSDAGPVAALTRASIRPLKALRFWRHSPPSERSLLQASGCQLAVGLGEAPVLRQATFSVWDSQGAMDAYARSGAHLQAIRAAAEGDFFSETLFARFTVLNRQGRWRGRPLSAP
jgi:spheroidene monooxygenase